jgi:ribose transport system substrate-binding protein
VIRGLLAVASAGVIAVAIGACGSSSGSSTGSSASGGATAANASATQSSATASGQASTSASAAELQAKAGIVPGKAFCGSKPITLGVHDGFGLNGWSKASYAIVRSTAAECPNVKQVVQAGGGQVQKTISDINGMVAQGINALVVIPDFGASQLPALRAATRAGVKVVAWASDPTGQKGADWLDYVDWDPVASGATWAKWVATALHGKGNVVFLGGPPGTPVSQEELQGAVTALKAYPNIKLLTGTKNYVVTNWDPAAAQKAMSALLARYPKIDGAIIDYGASADGALRAFTQANRKIPPIATTEANNLACDWKKLKSSNPDFQLATISSRNWMGRIATRKAIAAAEGVPDNEPSIFKLSLTEDSLAGKTPKCDTSYPPDWYFSNQLSQATFKQYGKTG